MECPDCGHAIGRDINGAFNKMLKALRDTSTSGVVTLPDCAIHRNFRQLPDFSGLNVSVIVFDDRTFL